RACRFPHWLAFGPATKYELLPPDTASTFAPESYEFVPFVKFPGHPPPPPCPYLTDFVGKVITLGKPNHVSRGSGFAPVQTIVVVDSSGLEVEVSLWSELSNVLDADTIPLDDMSNPVIVAFLGFQIRTYMGKITSSSGLASRIIQDPLHPAAESLRVHFAGQQRSVRCIVPKFDSLEKLAKHVQESYRTLRELDEMYIAAGDSCSSVVVPYGSDFWCKKHDTVPSAAVAHRYRLKLLVSDSTSASTFLLLGHVAGRIMPIPASELAVAYSDDYGAPRPPLQMMIGQKVVFGVHLPRHFHVTSYEDFRISKIWGLNMPRAQLLAQLPPLRLPQRTPSPPSRHETPIPSDPAYVPHFPTYSKVSPVPKPNPIESSSVPRYLMLPLWTAALLFSHHVPFGLLPTCFSQLQYQSLNSCWYT
ncbi:Replication protein A 70 kDa DNA-binding subunit E, partial [Linum grandiflorum]